MRTLFASVLVVATSFGRLDPCSGGGGGGDGTANPGTPAGEATGGAQDGGAQGGGPQGGGAQGGGATQAVTIPDIFYDGWTYKTATLYEKGKDNIVSSLSGTAEFNRDLTYEQSYYIGSILNSYAGKYVVNGPDPRVKGAFFITTYDQTQKEVFKLSIACGDTRAMAMTIYGDDGEPSIIYGLETNRKK